MALLVAFITRLQLLLSFLLNPPLLPLILHFLFSFLLALTPIFLRSLNTLLKGFLHPLQFLPLPFLLVLLIHPPFFFTLHLIPLFLFVVSLIPLVISFSPPPLIAIFAIFLFLLILIIVSLLTFYLFFYRLYLSFYFLSSADLPIKLISTICLAILIMMLEHPFFLPLVRVFLFFLL